MDISILIFVSYVNLIRPVLALTALLGLCAVASPTLAYAPPLGDGPWVVSDLGSGEAVVAGWSTERRNQTLDTLIAKWGKPNRCGATLRGNTGTAIWTTPAVRVSLATWGAIRRGSNVCRLPRQGKIWEITTIGPKWVTDRGLSVGTFTGMGPNYAVRNLYPDARWEPAGRWDTGALGTGVWLLEPFETPCLGDCGDDSYAWTSAVRAVERDDAIVRFQVGVYAAGE